jgi:hypothetical protein
MVMSAQYRQTEKIRRKSPEVDSSCAAGVPSRNGLRTPPRPFIRLSLRRHRNLDLPLCGLSPGFTIMTTAPAAVPRVSRYTAAMLKLFLFAFCFFVIAVLAATYPLFAAMIAGIVILSVVIDRDIKKNGFW